MVEIIELQSKMSRFKPSSSRLAIIAEQGKKGLLAASQDKLGNFAKLYAYLKVVLFVRY